MRLDSFKKENVYKLQKLDLKKKSLKNRTELFMLYFFPDENTPLFHSLFEHEYLVDIIYN